MLAAYKVGLRDPKKQSHIHAIPTHEFAILNDQEKRKGMAVYLPMLRVVCKRRMRRLPLPPQRINCLSRRGRSSPPAPGLATALRAHDEPSLGSKCVLWGSRPTLRMAIAKLRRRETSTHIQSLPKVRRVNLPAARNCKLLDAAV